MPAKNMFGATPLNRQASHSQSGFSSGSWSRYLLAIVDAGLAGIVFLAPLFMGGRHPLGQFVLTTLVFSTAVAWALRQCLQRESRWIRSGAEWILVVGMCILSLQLAPLPKEWLLAISPALSDLLPLWNQDSASASGLGEWSQLSLTPQATRAGMVMFLTYGMLFMVAVQRLQSLRDVERLLKWIGLSAAMMAGLGLLQYFFSNGSFLWIYEHPFRNSGGAAKGAFANENHFAHFMALGLGPLIFLLHRLLAKKKKPRQGFQSSAASQNQQRAGAVLVTMAIVLVAFAGLLSFSRGGVIALFAAAAVCMAVYWRYSLFGGKSLAAIAAAGVLCILALCIHGYEPLARQLTSLSDGSIEQLDSKGVRRKLWAADMKAIRQFPLLGTGVGSHAEVAPIYYGEHSDLEWTHAECGPLQIVMETGLAGVLLLSWGVGLCCYWIGSSFLRSKSLLVLACLGAMTASCVVSVLHSLIDFVWYIPACISITLLLIACACRVHQITAAKNKSPTHRNSIPRAAWASAAVVLMAISFVIINNRLGPAKAALHWDRYLAISLADKEPQDQANFTPNEQAASKRFDPETARLMREHLEKTLLYNPNHPRANLRMALMSLRKFDEAQQHAQNVMSVADIRNAALSSSFSSRDGQNQWLNVAVGENRKYLDRALARTRRGLKLSPLQGEGYLYLSELYFLDGNSPGEKDAYIEQALIVRPHDGDVLIAAGGEAGLRGDSKAQLAFWKQAFHCGEEYQKRLIELLAKQVNDLGYQLPASLFLTQFDPDLSGMEQLFAYYRTAEQNQDAAAIGNAYADMLKSQAEISKGAMAADLWHEARGIYRYLGDGQQAAACARKAVAAAPNDFYKRQSLASLLLEMGEYDESIEQFEWCLRRRPNNEVVMRTLIKARKGKMAPSAPPDYSAGMKPKGPKRQR